MLTYLIPYWQVIHSFLSMGQHTSANISRKETHKSSDLTRHPNSILKYDLTRLPDGRFCRLTEQGPIVSDKCCLILSQFVFFYIF